MIYQPDIQWSSQEFAHVFHHHYGGVEELRRLISWAGISEVSRERVMESMPMLKPRTDTVISELLDWLAGTCSSQPSSGITENIIQQIR